MGLQWDRKSTGAKDSMYCIQTSHSGCDAIEKRMLDSCSHILCRFQKSKGKVPPPSLLSTKDKKVFLVTISFLQWHFSFPYLHKSCAVFFIFWIYATILNFFLSKFFRITPIFFHNVKNCIMFFKMRKKSHCSFLFLDSVDIASYPDWRVIKPESTV